MTQAVCGDVAATATRSRPLTIFIVHPSDMITDHLPHGDGTIAWGFIRELARRGHRIHVAYQRVDLAEAPPPNVILHPIPTRKAWGLGFALEYAVRCRQLFDRLRKREHFDVAHQLNPVFGGLSLALVGTGVPIVLGTYVASWPCDWNGDPWVVKQPREFIRRTVLRLQQQPAAALLVTTRAALETRISTSRAIRARVRWQQHGTDTAAYAPDPRVRADALRSGRVLFLANLGVRKGIFTLIDAFAQVHERRPDARLVIAGGGPSLADVRARIDAAGLAAVVDVLGNVSRSDVPGLLHSSAVFCAPSLGEPYATTVIEAMAAGLPLVVTDSGGLAELADRDGACYVQPRDATGLAAALLTVLNSPERARAMGDHNLDRARAMFDWSTVVSSLEATYADVAQRAPVR